jgi:hypothetical protein
MMQGLLQPAFSRAIKRDILAGKHEIMRLGLGCFDAAASVPRYSL